MKDFFKETEEKKVNKKKMVIAVVILILIAILITLIVIYNSNIPARRWIDKHIYRKELQKNKVT